MYAEECACNPRAVYGSSGKLTAQITAGAPYDVFLSAGTGYADTLYARGFGAAAARKFADGYLVAWALDTTPDFHYIPRLSLPGNGRRLRYAIANPVTAPYGLAAEQFLRNTDMWQALQPQLVYGESVGQAAQFVLSGAAGVGYVAQSIPLGLPEGERGRIRRIPASLCPPVPNSALVVVKEGGTHPSAGSFVAFLASPTARRILEKSGYRPG